MSAKIKASIVLFITLTPLTIYADNTKDINDYVYGMKYDPRVLLSVKAPGNTESLPGRDAASSSVIICENIPRDLSKNLDEVTILSPINGTIFPGALVKADQNLANGQPAAITVARGPLTISADLPGLGKDAIRVINDASNSKVNAAIQEILEYWNKNPAAEGYVNPARSSYSAQQAYSSDQLALQLGFSTKWAGNKVSGKLNFKKSSKKSLTVMLYKQAFYTITADAPHAPADVFANSASLTQIKQQTDQSTPPAYVSSVDYGRIILVMMETDSVHTEEDLEGALDYVAISGQKTHVDTNDKYEKIAQNSRFTVLTIGGDSEVASELVGDYKKLPEVITKNAKYSRSNPGLPIAYRVVFLKDNAPAIMSFATNYVETHCTEYPNGYVKLFHQGGYVARWNVSWKEGNASKNYKSGKVTAGWRHTVNLPGDAKSVRIHAEAMTGLVWQPWNEAINKTINGPDNKCYKIYGTTLSPNWNNNCN